MLMMFLMSRVGYNTAVSSLYICPCPVNLIPLTSGTGCRVDSFASLSQNLCKLSTQVHGSDVPCPNHGLKEIWHWKSGISRVRLPLGFNLTPHAQLSLILLEKGIRVCLHFEEVESRFLLCVSVAYPSVLRGGDAGPTSSGSFPVCSTIAHAAECRLCLLGDQQPSGRPRRDAVMVFLADRLHPSRMDDQLLWSVAH